MTRCDVAGCRDPVAAVVAHPYRPEDRTQVCEVHAERIVDELDGDREAAI